MQPQDLTWRIIDRPDETFKIHRSLYTDQQIFDLEMEHIWESNWIYIGHDSQLPKPFDYITTHIGRQPVIIARDGEGRLGGFINACSHRGAQVCRKARGNAKTWTCPYHGFIFASLRADVQDLKTHLAAAAPFLEMFANQSEQGLEVLRGASTYTHRGNWKMQAENGVDGYHADTVHASYFRLAQVRAQEAAKAGRQDDVKAISVAGQDLRSGNYDLGNGHVIIWTDIPNFRDRALGMQYDALVERVGELQARWMAARLRQVLIYPNVILFDGISTQLRSWRPIATDETEVHAVCVAPRGEPAEARERRVRQYEDFYGASGIATPDDLTEFDACQTGYHGRLAQWQDFDRGMARRIVGADDVAQELGLDPAVSAGDFADETLYHGEYRQWLKLMLEGIERKKDRKHAA